MKQLLELFLDFCMLRAKPQDVPSAHWLFGITLAIYLATGFLSAWVSLSSVSLALTASFIDLALLLLCLRGGLYFFELEARFIQTATAIFGAMAILNLLAIPLQTALLGYANAESIPLVVSLPIMVLVAWSLVVLGHIIRHTFNLSFGGGVAIALVYYVLLLLLIEQLLPIGI